MQVLTEANDQFGHYLFLKNGVIVNGFTLVYLDMKSGQVLAGVNLLGNYYSVYLCKKALIPKKH